MLPPQLRVSAQRSLVRATSLALKAASIALVRSSASYQPNRSFWWRRCLDWTSHNDPSYYRFNRIRTLKTRAKLLEKMRRRGKFIWDADQSHFFTPKHIRWASHWGDNGSGHRRRWPGSEEPLKQDHEAQDETTPGSDRYELSHREKVWKEQVERMRRRIASDPYEAIFGKRFEPFWSPLVPSWMREEMGLQSWPKQNELPKSTPAESATPKSEQTPMPTKSQVDSQSGKSDPIADVEAKSTPASTSYAYASSTSWDSWTNKTKRVEWDSVSNQTKQFEYDPVSNRMVTAKPAETVTSAEVKSISESKKNLSTASNHFVADPSAKSIPVKQSSDLRRSIPLPPPTGTSLSQQPQKSLTYPLKVAVSHLASKPAAIAKLPASDLDLLTADDVRASMGKMKSPASAAAQSMIGDRAQLEQEYDMKSSARDAEVDSILNVHDSAKGRRPGRSEWDRAESSYMLDHELQSLLQKKEKLLKDERGLFHVERQKSEIAKLDTRIRELVAQMDTQAVSKADVSQSKSDRVSAVEPGSNAALQPALERHTNGKQRPTSRPVGETHGETNSAALTSGVPKNWIEQADMLQSDRIRRTQARPLYPMKRWIDDMEERKLKFESSTEVDQATAELNAVSYTKLQKANQMLQDEINEQKLRMQNHENTHTYARNTKSSSDAVKAVGDLAAASTKQIQNLEQALNTAQQALKDSQLALEKQGTAYKEKVKSLRAELELAYRQSTVHSEEHLERIRNLEKDLAQAHEEAAVRQASESKDSNAYREKLRALRGELDLAYKQSSVHAEKHLERVMYLEKELKKATDAHVASEQAADGRLNDRELIRTVREIYENRYGVIDVNHRQTAEGSSKPITGAVNSSQKQPQVVEVESNVDLGEALANYEKEQPVRSSVLENEIAAREREAHEAQASLLPENAAKMRSVISDAIKPSSTEATAAVPTEKATVSQSPVGKNGIEWESPAIYKVLAYDSGNDFLSVATTTANFTGAEAPIAIQQALSQLYQPARFVPHFAELQKDGYQVIYGTKDLLVFKKVKSLQPPVPANHVNVKPEVDTEFPSGHAPIDNEINRPYSQHTRNELSKTTGINPIDGMRVGPATGNFASPTGFVNHDPIFPSEPTPAVKDTNADGVPPITVRREEAHFTGTTTSPGTAEVTPGQPQHSRHWNSAQHRRARAEERAERRRMRRPRRRSPFAWAVKTGLGVAAVMYLIGAAEQKSRERNSRDADREEWARKAEEVRRKLSPKE